MPQPVNRLATPLPDSVLDRYFLDPEHPERLSEDPRRRGAAKPMLPFVEDETWRASAATGLDANYMER